ncbi:homoserine dehydrogenase [Virgibacillus sp. L01]|uniref:homoserine dehydrogenase n=1 Tax=Virgibacillus sp. L01 TaxID=3457429 RepID=UPI003FD0F94C
MRPINIALIGLGTVGCGVYQTLHIHQQRLEKLVGAPINISTIIIEHPDKHQKIAAKTNVTTDVNTVLNNPEIDVVFEAIVGKEPAFSLLRKCIQAKKHVITSNKEMFATHGDELKNLASRYNVRIGYDATTAGGIPIIQTIQQLLKANQIQYVQAILNGTTNFILSAMREKNITFSSALDEAQNWGYAESNPENDIDGFDAFYKLMILSDLIFEKQPDIEHVTRVGIRNTTEESIQALQTEGKRLKHIAKIGHDAAGNLTASVELEAVSKEHPLYAVEGVNNAIHIKGDIVGDLTFTGPGAGSFPTASAMIEDFCILFKKERAPIAIG